MGRALEIRDDLGRHELRGGAPKAGNGRASARAHAIANALDGLRRAEAARLAGMERQCYAAAITRPDALAAIAYGYLRRIAVTFVEWADAASQDVVVPWTVIDGEQSARRFANTKGP